MPQARGRRGPALALIATVLLAAGLLAGLSIAVPSPWILSDELRYTLAAASLADGDGLAVRGQRYEFGPLYPGLLAAILAVLPDRDLAYPIFKAANAAFFALAAIPIYLLARRLLAPGWSLAVAALSLAIPSSVYVSLVMTESLSYLAASLAFLAIVVALERPTPGRQAAALAAVGGATLARPQFAVLFVAYLAALVLQWALTPSARPVGALLRAYWPTVAALGLALATFIAAPLLTGSSHAEQLGAYQDLWRGYDPVSVARWMVHHLAALELYLAVVPIAVAPVVLARLATDARAGAERSGAFLSAFLSVNALLLLVAAAFSSAEFGFDRLHDRYLFYVAPLWLVVLATWLRDGLPRPRVALAVGAALALVLPAFIPFGQLAAEGSGAQVDAVVTHLWSRIHEVAFEVSPEHLSGRRVLAAAVAGALVLLVSVPRRLGLVLLGVVAAAFLAASTIAWADARNAATDAELVLGRDADWVDRTLGGRSEVTSLYVAPCGGTTRARLGLLLTEYFNRSVVDGAHLVHTDGSLLPSTRVRLSDAGVLVRDDGRPLVARYVLAPADVELDGRVLASGTSVPLSLWRVGGAVRAVGGPRIAAIKGGSCRARE